MPRETAAAPLSAIAHTARDFVVVGMGNYGAIALSLAISMALTRRLGAEVFGHLALLLMASQVLSFFVFNWTHIGCIRFGAHEYGQQATVAATVWTRMWIIAPWMAAAGAVMVVARGALAAYLGVPVWGLGLVFAHFVCAYAVSLVGAIFQSRQQMRQYGAMLFLEKAVLLTAVLLAPVVWIHGSLQVLGVYVLSTLLVSVIGLAWVGRRALLPVRADRGLYSQMWRFSLPMIVSGWVGLLGTYWLDYLMIKWYLPLRDLGWYALAAQVTGMVQQVTIIFSTLVLPRISILAANQETEKIKIYVVRFLPYWLLGASFLFCAVLLSIGALVPLTFGAEFRGAVAPLAVLMLASVALALYNALTPVVCAYGDTWPLAVVCVVSALTNVGVNLWLIPRYGIVGAAAATVVAYWVSALGVLGLVQRRLSVPLTPLVTLGLPVAAVYVCLHYLPAAHQQAAAILTGALSIAGLLFAFRLFRGENAIVLHRLESPATSAGAQVIFNGGESCLSKSSRR